MRLLIPYILLAGAIDENGVAISVCLPFPYCVLPWADEACWVRMGRGAYCCKAAFSEWSGSVVGAAVGLTPLLLYFPSFFAVRCIGHRSALHLPLQHAASGFAPLCAGLLCRSAARRVLPSLGEACLLALLVLLALLGQIMLSEVEAAHLQDASLVPEAAQEVVEAGLLQWAPSRLGNGYQAWVSQVIHIADVAHVLGPEGSLHTLVVVPLVGGYAFGYRHIPEGHLQIVLSAACCTGFAGSITLLAVDVIAARPVFCDDAVQSQRCRCACSLLAWMPAEDGCPRLLYQVEVGSMCRHALVPECHLASPLLQVFGHLCDEIALQRSVVGLLLCWRDALGYEALQQLLALLVVLPCCAGALIAAYVHIFAGEHVHHFGKHIACELHCCGVGNVEHVAIYTALVGLHLVFGLGVTAEFRV